MSSFLMQKEMRRIGNLALMLSVFLMKLVFPSDDRLETSFYTRVP